MENCVGVGMKGETKRTTTVYLSVLIRPRHGLFVEVGRTLLLLRHVTTLLLLLLMLLHQSYLLYTVRSEVLDGTHDARFKKFRDENTDD